MKLPLTGRLGSYAIRASSGGDVIADDTFEVAEFRAAEFKVAIESDKHDPSLDLAYRIAALFGEPVETIFDNPHA